MSRIDILAYKTQSYDTDSFIEDILRYSKNSVLLIFDFDEITVHHKPSNISLKNKTIRFFKTKNHKLNYYLSPLLLVVHIFIIFKLFFVLCYKYRPKVCWIENSYVALIVGFLRRLGLCSKSIYGAGDWVAVGSNRQKVLSYVGNNFIFPIVDYLACKFNDVVLNHTEEIAKARHEFWGREIAKKEKLYVYKMQIKTRDSYNNKQRKTFCFIGDVREDSGLDIAIKSLADIRRKQKFILKIIGPQRQYYNYIKKTSIKYNVNKYLQFLGFVDTDKLVETLSDCFCGISLITSNNSYSAYTISGKLIHYLQYLLPVIVTEGAGAFVPVIRNNELGIVIEPTKEAFINAVFTIYDEQEQYRRNIVKYINSLPEIDIKGLIEN
ncbi:glycosyltransferase [bacterium]|nr:glycosyltransferase [bacterium]